MKIVGVTGNIGSGKSTFCKIFEEKYKIPVLYTDILAKEIIKTNTSLRYKIAHLLGNKVFDDNGLIKRKIIFEKVFTNKELLDKFNNMFKPYLVEEIDKWVKNEQLNNNSPYIIIESALIFEVEMENKFDYVFFVDCPLHWRIQRASKRTGVTEENVRLINDCQMNTYQKSKKADFVINNNSDLTALEAKVEFYHQALIGVYGLLVKPKLQVLPTKKGTPVITTVSEYPDYKIGNYKLPPDDKSI